VPARPESGECCHAARVSAGTQPDTRRDPVVRSGAIEVHDRDPSGRTQQRDRTIERCLQVVHDAARAELRSLARRPVKPKIGRFALVLRAV